MNLFGFLVSALLPASVFASEPAQVGPLVKTVITSPEVINDKGDFFRVVLTNSEHDACIRIHKVNLRAPNPPRVLQVRRYCTFSRGAVKYSLDLDKHQESEITHLKWDKSLLTFKMSYIPAEVAALELELTCTLDPIKPGTTFTCK